MATFLEREKARYTVFKPESDCFSPSAAKTDGYYRTKDRPYCLPLDSALENLFPDIRQAAREFFVAHEIKWHDGQNRNPSNHLCDSQVCCVNFLFSFGDKPDALATLLRPLYPDLDAMEVIEGGRYVTFEWIGRENHLREKIARNGKRTRGANYTSTDAAVMFQRTDGKRQVVLIEWKYTESYGPTAYHIAKSGTSRVAIYQHLYDAADCPLDKEVLPDFESLFYEPFYQLMRQQFLAHKMEQVKELGADVVSVLHIAPSQNTNFHRITSPSLSTIASTATGVWQRVVADSQRFQAVSTESLFGALTTAQVPEMSAWLDYTRARYPWVWQSIPPN